MISTTQTNEWNIQPLHYYSSEVDDDSIIANWLVGRKHLLQNIESKQKFTSKVTIPDFRKILFDYRNMLEIGKQAISSFEEVSVDISDDAWQVKRTEMEKIISNLTFLSNIISDPQVLKGIEERIVKKKRKKLKRSQEFMTEPILSTLKEGDSLLKVRSKFSKNSPDIKRSSKIINERQELSEIEKLMESIRILRRLRCSKYDCDGAENLSNAIFEENFEKMQALLFERKKNIK